MPKLCQKVLHVLIVQYQFKMFFLWLCMFVCICSELEQCSFIQSFAGWDGGGGHDSATVQHHWTHFCKFFQNLCLHYIIDSLNWWIFQYVSQLFNQQESGRIQSRIQNNRSKSLLCDAVKSSQQELLSNKFDTYFEGLLDRTSTLVNLSSPARRTIFTET